MIYFRTRNGTIVLENLPDGSVVTVDGDTFNVEWPDGRGKGRASIAIPPGKHEVEVKLNGIRVSGGEVSVASQEVKPFIVRIDRSRATTEPAVPPAPSPEDFPEEVKNSVGMTFVLIPAGEFVMGSTYPPPAEDETPPHQVRISRPFYLCTCEVTQEQYQTIMHKNPSHFAGRPNNPVDGVTWFDAINFCNELSRREMLPPYYRIKHAEDVTMLGGKGYRLPFEIRVGVRLPSERYEGCPVPRRSPSKSLRLGVEQPSPNDAPRRREVAERLRSS